MKNNEKPKYYVVAAVVIDKGEILCVQKPKTKYTYTSFHWEYPGGKVEAGETEQQALCRELMEEMDYPIVADTPLCQLEYSYSDFSVNLHFWCCHPADAIHPRRFVLKEHAASTWIKPEKLHTMDWCAADCILPCLFLNQDVVYREFNCGLLPGVRKSKVIGVRTPILRAMAKHLWRNRPDVVSVFMRSKRHRYFEEQQLHSFLLDEMSSFKDCIRAVDSYLPYIDNWATCDQLAPKCFKGQNLMPYVERWLESKHPYAVRFGIATAMRYYLDEQFDSELLERIMQYRPAAHFTDSRDVYYIRMMQAWYFATAMITQWDWIFALLCDGTLEKETAKMAIRKGVESFRVSEEHKAILKSL